MRITNQVIAVVILSGLSLSTVYGTSLHREVHSASYQQHLREHGGQIYQASSLESAWTVDRQGNGLLLSSVESLVGNDENRLFIEAELTKFESAMEQYEASILYSRYIAEFWDLQAGYHFTKDQPTKQKNFAAIGLMGLAPYFIETKAYLYFGNNNLWSMTLELERELLLTQKLIMQPYMEMDIVLHDGTSTAAETGIDEFSIGVKTHYEINKKIRPFIDLGYYRDQDQKPLTNSWRYGGGLAFSF